MAEKDIISKHILKRIALDMAHYLFELDINDAELLETEFQRVEDRRADLLMQVKQPEQYLLHIEVQNANDAQMPLRMLRYFTDIALAYPKHIVKQYVVYIGHSKLRMRDSLVMPDWRYCYHLLDMHRVDCQSFLQQDNPDALVLAILCDFKEQDARTVVRYILQRLQVLLKDDSSRLRDYLGMLEILSSNRNLQHIVNEEESMLSSMKLSDLPSYQQGMQQGIQQGKQEGKQEGEAQTKLNIARTMLANGFELSIIMQCTGLDKSTLDDLQTEEGL